MSHRAPSTNGKKPRSGQARLMFALFRRKSKKHPWEQLPGELEASNLREAIIAFVAIPENRRLRKKRLVIRDANGKIIDYQKETTHVKVDFAEKSNH